MSDNLDIEKSPDHLKKPSIASGVKSLNKKPIAIISGAVILLLIGLGYAAASRGQSNNAPVETTEEGKKSSQEGKVQLASMVDDLEKRGARQNSELNSTDPLNQYAPAGDPYAPQAGHDPMTPNNPPAMHRTVSPQNSAQSERDRIREEKQKLFMGAVSSPTKIKVEGNNGFGGGQPQQPSYQAPSAADRRNEALAASLNRGLPQNDGNNGEPNSDARNSPWMEKANKSYDYLATKKVAPVSPFEVKAGTVIPGVMITGVNSDLPGQILGVVSENVYDTGTGRHLLIPQGSKLVGVYSANVIFGQERVLVAWNRIIFPDAKTINLGVMPGTDQAGYAGLSDQVNNHYFKIFGSAFMMSMITGGIAVSSNNDGSQYTQTPSDQMIAAMIQQMGEVGKQLIQKNLNVAPTLEIRPGYRFNIFVTKDMILEPLRY